MIGPKLEGIQAGKPVRVLPTYKAAKYFRQHSRKTTPNDAVLSPLVAGGTVACCLQLNALLLRQVASFAALRIMILKQTKLNCFCVLKRMVFQLMPHVQEFIPFVFAFCEEHLVASPVSRNSHKQLELPQIKQLHTFP